MTELICKEPPIEYTRHNARIMGALKRARIADEAGDGTYIVDWSQLQEHRRRWGGLGVRGVGDKGNELLTEWMKQVGMPDTPPRLAPAPSYQRRDWAKEIDRLATWLLDKSSDDDITINELRVETARVAERLFVLSDEVER